MGKKVKNVNHKVSPIVLFVIVIVLASVIIYANNLFNNSEQNNTIQNDKDFFTIIMLPDTQNYSQSYPDIFLAQTEWIVQNKENLNIVFVAHAGDIVNVPSDKNQWINAQNAMQVLTKNNISYGASLGNHDYTSISKRETLFKDYFTQTDFGTPILRDTFESDTSIVNITASGKELTLIFFPFCPDKNMLNWAKEKLVNNDNEKFMFTHAYLGSDASRFTHVCNSTQYIWDDFIKTQKHLGLVGSGHVHTEAIRFSKNDFNEPVIEFVSDYQTYSESQSGYLKILTFYPKENLLVMSTFSPNKNKFLSSKIDGNFIFEFN